MEWEDQPPEPTTPAPDRDLGTFVAWVALGTLVASGTHADAVASRNVPSATPIRGANDATNVPESRVNLDATLPGN